jgi:hypothetical protein
LDRGWPCVSRSNYCRPNRVTPGIADSAERGVVAVLDLEIGNVAAIDVGQVVLEPGNVALHPDRGRQILHLAGDQRQEAIGIEGRADGAGEDAVAQILDVRIAVASRGTAVEGRALAVADAVAAEDIEFRCRTQIGTTVQEEIEIGRLRIAIAVVDPIEAQSARIDGAGRGQRIVAARVEARTVGRVAIAISAGQVQIAAIDETYLP